ncbi:nucleotidyltransferase family protein [Larkinella sp. VNQ87]|uniref:nucleotidyltransferase family protein n=1 Tax=Larkinella sp. VNQ87 TaxID=3400921 RepID=UPI003C07549A
MKKPVIDQQFILQTLVANRDRLRAEFGIEQIGLFGSFARNEQTENSDIDIVYKLLDGHSLFLDDKERLQRILRRQLRRKLDLIDQRYLNPFTKYTLQKEVIYV